MESLIWLGILGVLAFVQNMAFTLVSRSRNSGDPNYHRCCAWASNGIWFLCQVCIVKSIWNAIDNGDYMFVICAGIIYTLSTTEGSVAMMRHLLKTEKGKRRVGARAKEDQAWRDAQKGTNAIDADGLRPSDYRAWK